MTNNNLQDERELLPCPFCGGEAETDSRRSYRNITTGHMGRAVSVYCLKCNVENTICCEDQPEDSPENLLAHLIEQWNTRAALASAEQAEPVAWRVIGEDGKPLTDWIDGSNPERPIGDGQSSQLAFARPAPSAMVEALRTALEKAQNGLRWYQDAHPEDSSPADDELHEEIDDALALIPPEAEQPAAKNEALALPDDGAYIISFDDASVPDETFVGHGARGAASRRFDQVSASWNAHLFVKIKSNSRDCEIPDAQALDEQAKHESGKPRCEWREINTADFSDDLIWLYDGVDSIEGPRTLEHDDYDRFPYWAECTWPSTSVIDAKRAKRGG